MGKWKCLWCSKVLEGESFMDLVAASMKEEGGQHVHGWENIAIAKVKATAVLKNKLVSVWFSFIYWLLCVCILNPDF
ncbi:MAG: hypothetical protein WA941_09490 [Nitrososphaeraceae archaeon]